MSSQLFFYAFLFASQYDREIKLGIYSMINQIAMFSFSDMNIASDRSIYIYETLDMTQHD